MCAYPSRSTTVPQRAEAKSIQELWLWVGKTEPQTLGSSQQDDQTAEKSQT